MNSNRYKPITQDWFQKSYARAKDLSTQIIRKTSGTKTKQNKNNMND